MLTLFNSLVRSILEYCSPLWNLFKVADIQELEGVQRTFTSKISVQHLHYWDHLRELIKCPQPWNYIPRDLTEIWFIDDFKSKVIKFLLFIPDKPPILGYTSSFFRVKYMLHTSHFTSPSLAKEVGHLGG